MPSPETFFDFKFATSPIPPRKRCFLKHNTVVRRIHYVWAEPIVSSLRCEYETLSLFLDKR